MLTLRHSVVQDIVLCAIATEHAGDCIAPVWRFALLLLGGVRRWLFLPSLVMVTPTLVLLKGGDALSICFNTIAMLFLCEIDNLAYAVFLPERLHARVEDEGRVELEEVEAVALMRSKATHVAMLVLVVPCAVAVGGGTAAGSGGNGGGRNSLDLGLFLPVFAFWVAGAAEAAMSAVGVGEACKQVGMVTGRWLLGVVAFFALYIIV